MPLSRRRIGHFENRRRFIDFIEHGDVGHVDAQVGRGYELPPIKFTAEAWNRRTLRGLAFQIRPTESWIDDWKICHPGCLRVGRVGFPISGGGLLLILDSRDIADIPWADDVEAPKCLGPVGILVGSP